MSDRKFYNPGFGIVVDLEDKISQLQIEIERKDAIINELKGRLAGDTCNMCNWLERGDCHKQKEELQTEIESLRGERDRYKLRLSELCQLKAIKDKYGKTAEYKLRQPSAWKDAFTLLQEKKDE